MPTTPILSLPYPLLTDDNNPPADFQALGLALDALLGAWTEYTPTVTGTASPTVVAQYKNVGKLLTVDFLITYTAAATGPLVMSIPAGLEFASTAGTPCIGVATLRDASPSVRRHSWVVPTSTTAIALEYEQSNVNTGITATTPWTWAAGDQVAGMFTGRLK